MEVMVDHKRAAAYCRVSTGMECQEGSYETQIKYYKDLISNDPDEELVKIYADEGSGRTTQGRPEFQQMMQDCENGKIDVIYTKSISRFSRNMLDCVTAVRRLKELGIAVILNGKTSTRWTVRTSCSSTSWRLSLRKNPKALAEM